MNGKTTRGPVAESRIGVTDRAEGAVIDIVGVIGRPEQLGDAGGEQGTSYARLAESIERIRAIAAPEVVVNIRSTGGDVHDALLIYDALKSLDARIVTRCYGYTASAATRRLPPLSPRSSARSCRACSTRLKTPRKTSSSASAANTVWSSTSRKFLN